MHHVTILLFGLVSGVVSQLPSMTDAEREQHQINLNMMTARVLLARVDRALNELFDYGYREDTISRCYPCTFRHRHGRIGRRFRCVDMMLRCSEIPNFTIRKPCICPGKDQYIRCGVLPNGFKLLTQWKEPGKRAMKLEKEASLEAAKIGKNGKRDQEVHQNKDETKKWTNETNIRERKVNSHFRETGMVKGESKEGTAESKEGIAKSKERKMETKEGRTDTKDRKEQTNQMHTKTSEGEEGKGIKNGNQIERKEGKIEMKKGDETKEVSNENIIRSLNQSEVKSIEMGDIHQYISHSRHRYTHDGFGNTFTMAISNLSRRKRHRDTKLPRMYYGKRRYRTKHFDINLMPWVVLLSQWRSEWYTILYDTWCNGFLVDKLWIITIADCVYQWWKKFRFDIGYKLRVHYFERSKNASLKGKWTFMIAKKIHVHPKFSAPGSIKCDGSPMKGKCLPAYNVALVELPTPIGEEVEELHPCFNSVDPSYPSYGVTVYTVGIRGYWNQHARWMEHEYNTRHDRTTAAFANYKFGSETRYMSGTVVSPPHHCNGSIRVQLFPYNVLYYHNRVEFEAGHPQPGYTEGDLGSPVVRYNERGRLEVVGIVGGWLVNCVDEAGLRYPQTMAMINLHARELREWIYSTRLGY